MADNTEPAITEAIVSYDGIFKGMYDESLRKLFHEGRKLLSVGEWKQGKATFSQALENAASVEKDRKTLTLILSEINRYEKYKIHPGTETVETISWETVTSRKLCRLDESIFELPQSIFFLDIGKPGQLNHVRLLGRKILSDLWIKFKIPEIHCSFVTADMILGVYQDERVSESNVTVFYNPMTNPEKLYIMDKIRKSNGNEAELIFPFSLLRETTRKEHCSPPEGWIIDDAFAIMLGCGEDRIRQYTIEFLKSTNLSKPKLYDPACSTGVFLSTLKKAFPDSYTIGQDLSAQMAAISRERVDEVHCGNAMNPLIEAGTADAVFIRFLNSEVVKTKEAEELLQALLLTVKNGGYIVTFGHTPVLLSSSNFKMLEDFEYKQSVGVAVEESGIFQYYVIQKCNS
ncbi:hypothetical protein ACJMK2_036135 [Sinanodonta woodiana]|uniref:Methyltransferase domain-containing protein n=1 Tax=Sinanodonta woodiana TaxID=1069815 RepID=A0ABD3WGH9_SINWO